MKKVKKKKYNYFRLFLYILLGISLLLYIKLYILDEKVKNNINDLPDKITNIVWYESNSLDAMQFSSGNFQYYSENNDLNSCSRYYYNSKDKVISFSCKDYSMKLVSVSDYKLIVVLSGDNIDTDVYTYYNSLDLVNYLIENDIKNISDENINKIMKDNNFSISKLEYNNFYKNAQLSKLSSIDELSIDQYLSLKNNNSDSIILLINPNMSIDSYDFIPLFVNWKDKYDKYNFYYINGFNLKVNDYDLLEKDKLLKEYLIGLYDNNIIIFENGEFKRISIDVYVDKLDDEVFNCLNDSCNDVNLKVYDNERNYKNIDEILNK